MLTFVVDHKVNVMYDAHLLEEMLVSAIDDICSFV
jgi:hypothetical protein